MIEMRSTREVQKNETCTLVQSTPIASGIIRKNERAVWNPVADSAHRERDARTIYALVPRADITTFFDVRFWYGWQRVHLLVRLDSVKIQTA